MSKQIEINFVWSKSLAIKASKLYYNWDMKNSYKRFIGWLFIALTQFAIVGALKHHAFGLLFISTFLVIYWYYGRWYLREKMIVKFYNKSNLDNQKIKFTVKPDGLSHEDSLTQWDDIQTAIKLDDGIVLQTTQNTLYFTVESFGDYEDFLAFIKILKDKDKL
jgi:hypothetical protein